MFTILNTQYAPKIYGFIPNFTPSINNHKLNFLIMDEKAILIKYPHLSDEASWQKTSLWRIIMFL